MIVNPQGKPVPVREEHGQPIIQIELDKTPNESWRFWFGNPTTSYKWTTSLTPQMCYISGNKLEFPSDYAKAEEHIKLVLEWIDAASKASEHAEAKQKEKLHHEEKEKDNEKERLQKLREKLLEKF